MGNIREQKLEMSVGILGLNTGAGDHWEDYLQLLVDVVIREVGDLEPKNWRQRRILVKIPYTMTQEEVLPLVENLSESQRLDLLVQHCCAEQTKMIRRQT